MYYKTIPFELLGNVKKKILSRYGLLKTEYDLDITIYLYYNSTRPN